MEEKSRTENSIFNIGSSIVIYFFKIILAFVVRTIFIVILDETYLGVNGLLTNLLSMLSLAELGIGTAISFSLYKPLAEKDEKQVSALMTFYKKCYTIIGIVVTLIGLVLFVFLKFIIKDYDSIPNLNIIYLLYLLNTVSTYFISYKEILITADQKAYKLTKINIIFNFFIYFGQAISLLISKNFIAYLIVQFAMQIIQRIVTNNYISKEYKNVNYNSKEKIEENAMQKIKINVKAMFFHKIGDYCINGTDNLIITSLIDISTVGIFSNYTMFTTTINSLIVMIYTSITSSIGNLLTKENIQKSIQIFKKIDFIAFVLYSFSGIAMYAGLNKLIEIWKIGNQYLLDNFTVVLITFNYFFSGTRVASWIIKSAAGINNEDKFVPLVQSIVNLLASIIGARYLGLKGVILGTIISSLIPNLYRPFIIYKYVFKKSVADYYKLYFKYIFSFCSSVIIISFMKKFIQFQNDFLTLFISICLSIIIHIVICVLFFRKDINIEDYKTQILNLKFWRKKKKE